ncbi:lipoprotein insertase outer membrane protein LolB [Enterobacillus tribolii]|uniref:Outer-membrane lipoprotein LolB n=1 Tax=Enterobacillus tribolii TaxID=1487935 RepID=A0A370R4T6_9GAMM|nr:lipoprotein insertase outer membrane protein LolB [Enterobacillus tribolii]MBW7983357.1 lipoprotein localization protein LolB [Enterobacillus tribolii]RDK97416.1 outer membrane lipoprotein LolB [Enterobacillus tribolii]
MRKVNFLRLLPLSCVLLAACTTNAPRTSTGSATSPQWQSHEAQVKKIEQYQTRGAFAYISDRQKVYARFFWQQSTPERYRLLLTNPLGSTVMELNAQPGVVQLTDNNGKRYVSDNAETMIQKLTDMTIPLDSLRQWILGLPGDATDITLDAQHRLKSLNYTRGGVTWKVEYLNYNTDVQPALPSQLELTQGEQRIKLKMDNWTLQP